MLHMFRDRDIKKISGSYILGKWYIIVVYILLNFFKSGCGTASSQLSYRKNNLFSVTQTHWFCLFKRHGKFMRVANFKDLKVETVCKLMEKVLRM